MCKAFSCIVRKNGEVLWQFGVDSHSDLVSKFNLTDSRTGRADDLPYAKVEITPDNGSYLNPDKWTLHLDESVTPTWWTSEDEKTALAQHKKWLVKLNRILVRQEIINPFSLQPPKKITAKHLKLLKECDSVRASVRASVRDSVVASVGDSVWDSVWDSVGASVWDSVVASVRDSVWDSVWDSVGAYTGSFFNLPRKSWLYTDKLPQEPTYPFESTVKLWHLGLVPSFDGAKKWRLHGGPKAAILWKGETR